MRYTGQVLKWTWSDGFYFAHPPYGMWSIEQTRGRFHITLSNRDLGDQDFGFQPTIAKAKAEAQRAHRMLMKLEG